MNLESTIQRVEEFCHRLCDMYHECYQAESYQFALPEVTFEVGRKYAKVLVIHPNDDQGRRSLLSVIGGADSDGKSVYCFIDLSNGDILKASGKSTTAKGKRGSIWNSDCDVGTDKPANMFGSGLYKEAQ